MRVSVTSMSGRVVISASKTEAVNLLRAVVALRDDLFQMPKSRRELNELCMSLRSGVNRLNQKGGG